MNQIDVRQATSRAAYNRVGEFDDDHNTKIIRGLADFGPLNYEHLAFAIGLRPDQVEKRLTKLVADGKIGLTGKATKTSAERWAAEYCSVNQDKQ